MTKLKLSILLVLLITLSQSTQTCSPACKSDQDCINGHCSQKTKPITPIDKCAAVTCPAGSTCKDGVCSPIVKPCIQLCKIGYHCVDGKCVPIDKCTGVTCPTGSTCKDGVCSDPPCTKLCMIGYHCVKGQCVPITCTKNSDCPKGTTCKKGQCQLDLPVCPINSPYQAKICTDPRPQICPLSLSLYPLACGVKSDGTRVNFYNQCAVCQDKSIVYYFTSACYDVPFVCKPGENCLDYYCSGGCKASQDCPYDWQVCYKNKCVDRCLLLKCANCKYGQCNYQKATGACSATVKCKRDYWSCLNSKCFDLCTFQACPPNQQCKDGTCLDPPPVCPKCPIGYECQKSKCTQKKCNKNNECPKGTICIKNKCELDLRVCPANSAYQTNSCTDPRPTEKTCPTIYYFVPPYPNYCGVKADGTRVNFVEECSACKDTSIVYYFNTPCFKTPFVCPQGQNCLDYYCSSSCKTNQDCPYDWQTCSNNKCTDRCAFLKCLGCKYGICNYQQPSGSCSPTSKCKQDYWSCLGSKCVDLCSRQGCPPNYDCKNGACLAVK